MESLPAGSLRLWVGRSKLVGASEGLLVNSGQTFPCPPSTCQLLSASGTGLEAGWLSPR